MRYVGLKSGPKGNKASTLLRGCCHRPQEFSTVDPFAPLDAAAAFLSAALALLPPTLKVEVSTGLAVLAVVALGL
jgi:hypothetical protein